MNKKRWIVAVIVCCAISLISLVSYSSKKTKVLDVKTARVSYGDIKSYLSTTGIIKSANEKSYYPCQLKINNINVKVGDKIKKGDILIEYDDSEIQMAIKQAELQYKSALSDKETAVMEMNKIKEKKATLVEEINSIDKILKEEKENKSSNKIIMAISEYLEDSSKVKGLIERRQELYMLNESIPEIGEEQIKALDARINMAKGTLEIAKLKAENINSKVISESDGVVTAVNSTEGSFGNLTMPTIVVQDLDNLKVVLNLGKDDVSKIQLNQHMDISYGKNKYSGQVSFIHPIANNTQSKFPTDIKIDNSGSTLIVEGIINDCDSNLKVDFDSDVNVLLAQRNHVKTIPVEAVRAEKGGKYCVFTVSAQNIVVKKYIDLGIQSDSMVEVIKGLNIDESVIINPNSAIVDGIKVREVS